MPTTSPRVNVVLEEPLFRNLKKLAAKGGVSLSTMARDLIRQALADHEEACLVQVADERARTFKRTQAVTHAQVWK